MRYPKSKNKKDRAWKIIGIITLFWVNFLDFTTKALFS